MTAAGAHYPLAERREPAVMKYDDRACKDHDARIFYPEDYNTPRARNRAREQAIAICNSCRHRIECLEDALENHEPWGIWGGLTHNDRKRLQRGAA